MCTGTTAESGAASNDGRTLTTHYMRTGNMLSVVRLQEGKVCKRQTVNKRQVWVGATGSTTGDGRDCHYV